MSCLGLYYVPSSLLCHIFFMLCSIVFLRCFIFYLSFIFSFILHPSYILPLSISSFFPLLPLNSFVYSWQKWGEYIRVYRHFHMTLVHILRGRNSISCTFVGDEIPYGRCIYQGGEDISFQEKLTFFFFGVLYVYFLI